MYPPEVSTSNSDTFLHDSGCADVHMVGSGHYVDGFCWFLRVCILFPYLGPYQWLARPDILGFCPCSLSGTGSLITKTCYAVVEIGTNAVILYGSLTMDTR